jgi:hypothetical protein
MSLPRLSNNAVRLAYAPVLAFVALATNREYLCDFWHHLARGQAMIQQGSMVDRDLFTFTVAGTPLVDLNWLTQLGYSVLFDRGGLELVQVANAAVVALAMLVVGLHAWRASSSASLAALVALIALAGNWQTLSIRPQSGSLLLFAVIYFALDRFGGENPSKHPVRQFWLLIPPIAAALWVNLHGAFPLAIVLVGIFLAAALIESWQKAGWRGALHLPPPARWLSACLALTVLATFLNPYGWTVYQYVGGTSSLAAGRQIDEWVRPQLGTFIGAIWFASLVAGGLVLWHSPRAIAVRDGLLLVPFLLLSAGSVRMIPWWFMIFGPILARSLAAMVPAAWLAGDREEPSTGNLAVAGALAAVLALSLPQAAMLNPLVQKQPRIEWQLEQVADELRAAAPRGRVFTRLEWGEYLGWSLAGSFPVYMDGRIEIIPDSVWDEYTLVTCGQADWEQILDRHRVDHLVLDSRYHIKTGLLAAARQSSQWHEASQHGPAILFVRRKVNPS